MARRAFCRRLEGRRISQHIGSRRFEWAKSDQWVPHAFNSLKQVTSLHAIQQVTADPPDYFNTEDFEWVTDYQRVDEERSATHIREDYIGRFSEGFLSLLLFHGCRPEDLGHYFNHGIVPLDTDQFVQQARTLFLSGRYPELSEAHFEQALAEIDVHGRQGRLYLAVDRKGLESYGPHYILYGSEFLQAIASGLGRLTMRDYRKELSREGIPTVIECEIPVDYLSRNTLGHLACAALEIALNLKIGRWESVPMVDITFELYSSIPPDMIVDHYHPSSLVDPFKGNEESELSMIECQYCRHD